MTTILSFVALLYSTLKLFLSLIVVDKIVHQQLILTFKGKYLRPEPMGKENVMKDVI